MGRADGTLCYPLANHPRVETRGYNMRRADGP